MEFVLDTKNISVAATFTPNLLDNDDDFHPSESGSYLAAYKFYTALFGIENNNQYTPSNVPSSNLNKIREAALNAILE